MPLDTLAGYRLLRTLGSGSRADVMLAHPLRGETGPVVLKLYGPAVAEGSVLAEVEALTRAAGEHVVRLVDVVPAEDGALALVLERLAGGSLARLLAARQSLRAGEAVTILAPLALTLARLHAAGVAHGAVGPGAILFDTAGSPTLACFGRASLHQAGQPIARLEVEQAVIDDVLAFGSLASALLEGAGADELARRAATEAAPADWLVRFADALFDHGEALPVDLEGRTEAPVVRVVPVRAAVPAVEPEVPRRRILAELRRVRPRVWIAAGAALLAGLVALVALPVGGSEPAARTPAPAPTASAPIAAPVTADDPVDAALVLLSAREGCIRELDAGCLEIVDQAGSAALDDDRALIASIAAGEQPGALPTIRDPVLVQRLGDSALVSLGPDSEPASLLLVKGEAGWRIRDYVE